MNKPTEKQIDKERKMPFEKGDVVAFHEGKRKWIARIDDLYKNEAGDELASIIWRCSGCVTDDVPTSKLTPELAGKWR